MVEAPVLYVEDDANDVWFLRRAIEELRALPPLQVVVNGQAALDYLEGVGPFADRQAFPLPRLVLLDLNLPLISGFEVLRRIREMPQFKSLPVLILTASNLMLDNQTAQLLGANEFLTKPRDPSELTGLLQGIKERWL